MALDLQYFKQSRIANTVFDRECGFFEFGTFIHIKESTRSLKSFQSLMESMKRFVQSIINITVIVYALYNQMYY